MQNRRSNSVAVPERGRFMPAGQILLFGLLVLVALAAVFPGKRLQERLEGSSYSDPLSLAYLAAWLRAQPEQAHLRLVMARRQLGDGAMDAAERTLQPLLQPLAQGSPVRAEAELLQHDILFRRLWQQAPGSPAFMAARQAFLVELTRMQAYEWTPAQLQKFASEAGSLDASDLAQSWLQRLLKVAPERETGIRAELAAMALGRGHYRDAAENYFLAMQHARTLDERRHYFMSGVSALQSGNLLPEAVAAAQLHSPPLGDDPATLEYLVRLMRAANRLDLAQVYMARLLKQRVQVLPTSAPANAPPAKGGAA